MINVLFLLAYACSGMAALVFEVTWTRVLTLSMGRGIAASSTVLGAYMGGLALGAVVAGRRAMRLSPRSALHTYAGLELAAAAFAVAVPVVLRWLEPLLSAAYRSGDGAVTFGAVRFLVSLILVTIPALALGATFPVAVRGFAGDATDGARRSGWLYVVNTGGAAVGAFAAGFVLLPSLGVITTLLVGTAGSLVAASVAMSVAAATPPAVSAPAGARAQPHQPPPQVARDTRRRNQPDRSKVQKKAVPAEESQLWLTTTALVVSGAITLAAEVVWTRIVALLVGPSTYAFAATVATFITGLAVGGALSASLCTRLRRPAWVMAAAMGLAAFASVWAAQAAGTTLPRELITAFSRAEAVSTVLRSMRVAVVVLPFAIFVGAIFPAGLLSLDSGQASPHAIGIVYAANAVASVAGSLLAGFLIVPMIGLERSLQIIAAVLASAGVLTLAWGTRTWSWRLAGVVPVAAAIVLMVGGQRWDRDLLVTGAYKYAATIPAGADVETALKAGTLEYYRDGAVATVTVKRLTGTLSLAIDGKVDASSGGDMLTQKLLAHLPLLMHGAARRVGIIGLGSGITLASALTHPVEQADVLEISPEVVDASRLFFAPGQSPLDDARTRLLVTDGRTHLSLSKQTYDVLISEPSNPWIAGVAALFTREFFEAARRRLTDEGVICQWINTYDISAADLKSVVATFTAVFPHASLWLAGDGDLLIVGSPASVDARLDALARPSSNDAVRADLATAGVTSPFVLLSLFAGGEEAARTFAGGAAEQRDNRMALEFSAPMALRTEARRENVQTLRQLTSAATRPLSIANAWARATPDEHAQRARVLLQAGSWDTAYDAAREALTVAPGHAGALNALIDACVPIRRQNEAVSVLRAIVERHPDLAPPRIALSKLLAATGAIDQAIEVARAAVHQHPDDGAALEQLASIFSDIGDLERLSPLVEALRRFPDRAASAYYMAAQHFMRGELEPALASVKRALELDPQLARAQNLMGAILATHGETAAARAAFEAALRLDARDPTTYQNLATLEWNSGHSTRAAQLFAEALSLDPESQGARDGLARTRAAP